MLVKHVGVCVKELVSILSYMAREELSKASVILQVSLCYLLSLNTLVKMQLGFFHLEVQWKSQKFRQWVYTFIQE